MNIKYLNFYRRVGVLDFISVRTDFKVQRTLTNHPPKRSSHQ